MNDKDRLILDSLINPDVEVEAKYDFSEDLQVEILGVIVNDAYFLRQSLSMIDPSYFQDQTHAKICKIVLDFYNSYKILPKREYIEHEITESIPVGKHLLYLTSLDNIIKSYLPGENSRDFIVDKITEFAKQQAARKAINEVLELLKRNPANKWAKVYSLLQDVLKVENNLGDELDYFESVAERYDLMIKAKEEGEVFTSGFVKIDEALSSGGISRGEIAAWCGGSGTGKSVALVMGAMRNVLLGKKVLYISLEMDKYKVAERFDAQFSNIPINNLLFEKDLVIQSLKDCVEEYEDKKRLIIKQLPPGMLDVNMLRAILSQLSLEGFKTDLLIVDYVGEMKDMPGMKTYESRQRLVRDLRGLAVEEQIGVFTAMQPKREGKEAQNDGGYMDDDSLGDSYGQIRPLDALWTLNQTLDEKKANLGRIFIAKHRHGKSKIGFPYKQTLNLDMLEVTDETYADGMSAVRHHNKNNFGPDKKQKDEQE